MKKVLAVPTQAVFSEESGEVCYVRGGWGKFEKRQIKTGAQNEDIVQIISGLQEGETVSLTKPDLH